jgi:hypothetical protein
VVGGAEGGGGDEVGRRCGASAQRRAPSRSSAAAGTRGALGTHLPPGPELAPQHSDVGGHPPGGDGVAAAAAVGAAAVHLDQEGLHPAQLALVRVDGIARLLVLQAGADGRWWAGSVGCGCRAMVVSARHARVPRRAVSVTALPAANACSPTEPPPLHTHVAGAQVLDQRGRGGQALQRRVHEARVALVDQPHRGARHVLPAHGQGEAANPFGGRREHQVLHGRDVVRGGRRKSTRWSSIASAGNKQVSVPPFKPRRGAHGEPPRCRQESAFGCAPRRRPSPSWRAAQRRWPAAPLPRRTMPA